MKKAIYNEICYKEKAFPISEMCREIMENHPDIDAFSMEDWIENGKANKIIDFEETSVYFERNNNLVRVTVIY